MIRLSNGKELMFLMASGMMGFDCEGPTIYHKFLYKTLEFLHLYNSRLFTLITKTLTCNSIIGKKQIKPIRNGWWNNYQLDNPGLAEFTKKHILQLKEKNNVIFSFTGNSREDLFTIAKTSKILLPDIVALEYNISCPNYKYLHKDEEFIIEMCYLIKEVSRKPVILKIGMRNNYIRIAKKTEKIVEAIDINAVPAENGIGAISGQRAQKTNWRIAGELKAYTCTPVIGGSVWNYGDLSHLFEVVKVDAISFGSVSMVHPQRPWGPILPTTYVKKYLKGG